MSNDCRHVRLLPVLLLLAALVALSACTATKPARDYVEVRKSLFLDDPRLAKMTVHDRFDAVWPTVVETIEERAYEDVEREQSSSRELYTHTVSVEDQPRDETLRETVTEGRGRIVATTADGRLVALELEEQHRWGFSTLDTVNLLAGGDESRTLQHGGVEIRVPSVQGGSIHPGETRAVFEELLARFEEQGSAE